MTDEQIRAEALKMGYDPEDVIRGFRDFESEIKAHPLTREELQAKYDENVEQFNQAKKKV